MKNDLGHGGSEAGHAATRGAIASMAMTGMRVLTVSLGLVEQPPPQQLAGGESSGRRRAAVELVHWTVGAAAGAVYGRSLKPGASGRGPGLCMAW